MFDLCYCSPCSLLATVPAVKSALLAANDFNGFTSCGLFDALCVCVCPCVRGCVPAQVLQPTAAAPCPEVAGLSAAITAAAGGSNDNAVDVDVVMELLLSAWGAQRAADRQQLERVVLQTDPGGRGLANQDEFAALVKQVTSRQCAQ